MIDGESLTILGVDDLIPSNCKIIISIFLFISILKFPHGYTSINTHHNFIADFIHHRRNLDKLLGNTLIPDFLNITFDLIMVNNARPFCQIQRVKKCPVRNCFTSIISVRVKLTNDIILI